LRHHGAKSVIVVYSPELSSEPTIASIKDTDRTGASANLIANIEIKGNCGGILRSKLIRLQLSFRICRRTISAESHMYCLLGTNCIVFSGREITNSCITL